MNDPTQAKEGLDGPPELGWLLARKFVAHECQRLFFIPQCPFQLAVFDGGQDFFKAWSRLVACGDQVASGD